MKTKFKVGDRVFSYSLQEWGIVKEIDYSMHFGTLVKFNNRKPRLYTHDGRKNIEDKAAELFFDEVTIEPPQRPLQDKDIVMCWYNDSFSREYRFYDALNECTFFASNGHRNGADFTNMVYVPDEEVPQELVAMRDKLED